MANRLGLESDLGTNNAPKYPTRHNARETKLAETILNNKNIDESFDAPLVWSSVDQEGALLATSTPAAGDEIAFRTSKHNMLAHVQSINGTPVHSFPFTSADGLEINIDDDVTNGITGWEIAPSGILTTSRGAFTVGTDEDFYMEATIKIDDISDVTELAVGFRKAEAFQVNVDDYDEMASFNVGQDADGQIEIHTILNGAATSETDTTLTDWVDAGEHTLKIVVRQNGKCEFYYDGAVPTVTASFTFDNGEIVVPFIFLRAETGDPGVSISALKVGKL